MTMDKYQQATISTENKKSLVYWSSTMWRAISANGHKRV